MPETVNSFAGPSAAARMRSPIAQPWSSAVPWSITTSDGPAAHWPSTSWIGLKRSASASKPNPNEGAWPLPAASPLSL